MATIVCNKNTFWISSREVTNGVERKGKKKTVGRPPGPYTRKMIQKMSEPSLLVSSTYAYSFVSFLVKK